MNKDEFPNLHPRLSLSELTTSKYLWDLVETTSSSQPHDWQPLSVKSKHSISGLAVAIREFNKPPRPMSLCSAPLPQGPHSQGDLQPEKKVLEGRCGIGVSGTAGLGAGYQGASLPGATCLQGPSSFSSIFCSPFGSKVNREMFFSISL